MNRRELEGIELEREKTQKKSKAFQESGWGFELFIVLLIGTIIILCGLLSQ